MRVNPDNAPEKQEAYKLGLQGMTDEQLRAECNQKIWLSAYASNNPNSCYHWQCDATYDECSRREKKEIYSQEHAKLSKANR